MRTTAISFAILVLAAASPGFAQWVQTNGPEGGYIWCLAEDDAFIYAGTWGPVFRMSKADTTWSPLPPVAPWVAGGISCLLFTGTRLIAGAQGSGVFWSTDHGITWQRWMSGLDGAEGIGSFTQSGNDLFAGTIRGVYFSTDGGANWAATNVNYPNPFHPSTTIKYELPKSTMVALSVFDILGREVSVLVNGRRDAGVHAVKFDGSGLSSGVYLYRLTAGSFAQSRKSLLLR